MGIEQNFKDTVVFMLSSIMEEMQKAREESRRLAEQVELLRYEKQDIQEKLVEAQNKGLIDFLIDKVSVKRINGVS